MVLQVQALVDALRKLGPTSEKAVVFSQWTKFLDYIGDELTKEGIYYTRIDGSMDAAKRLESLKKFETEGCNSPDEPRLLLCSLKAAGTGINLTR